ncbi:MAG: arginine--tRNA ligase, partial [Clostridia bacterium]|nr:arginine--tRNA ligase [Clostridia bacterium]
MDYRRYIAERLKIEGLDAEEIAAAIVVPPDYTMGDYALPCFKLAKTMRKAPAAIAEQLQQAYPLDNVIIGCEGVNGYLNFKVNRAGLARDTISEILEKRQSYGSSEKGEGKTVCIDYSSINIAKPFHIGHLSTTVIGGALYRIFKHLGYNAVGINHL